MEWRLTFHVGVSNICKGSEAPWGMVCICRGYILSWRRKWQPSLVFLPGKSHGQRSLVGCSPWGCTGWTWLKWHSDWVGGGVGSEAGIRFPRQGSGTQLPLNWRFLEGRDYVFYSLTSEASFPSPLFITKQDPAGIDWLLDSRSLWGDMKESWMQEQQDHVCILGRPFWTSEGWTVTWRKKGAGWTCGQHG